MFVGPRVLNDSMWFWFEDVEGWARVGKGPKVRIGANSLLLIPRGVEHEIHHDGGEARLEAVHFHVTVYGGVNFLELLGFPAYIRASGESAALIGAVSSTLSREFAVRSPGWTRSMACDITRVLFELLRFHGSEFLPARSTELQHELLRLLPALDWLSANLSRSNIRVADLASHVHVCESQFRKLFLKTMGISPVRFVQRQRVERACAMLVATDDPIDQIADACGFADVPFFYRVFHAWTSTSPRQYRADVLSGRRDRLTS
jgi:AraC-like DNA-binding protein